MSRADVTPAVHTRRGHRALQAARHALKVPPVPRDFRTDIEGLRAISILGVVLWHAGVTVIPGGFVGVDVFFVVSGFLMTALLLEEGRARGRIDIPRFYARRARRLLPAALTALLGTAVLTVLTMPSTRWASIGADLAAAAGYVVNWRMASSSVSYLDVSRAPSPVQHYWSLSVEEQFYLVWPLLLLLLLVLARGRARHFLATSWLLTGVLFGGSLLASWWWTQEYAAAAYFVTPTRIFELMLGAGVALGASAWPTIPRLLGALLGWLGLALVVAGLMLIDSDTPFPGTAALVPTVGAALVVLAGASAGGWGPDMILRARWLQWIGRLSYSLYLWHWPFIAAAASLARVGRGGPEHLPLVWGLAAVAVSVIPAWLSFRYVEEPVRRHGRILQRVLGPGVTSWRTLRLGLTCTLTGVLAGLTLMVLAPTTVSSQPVGWRTPAVVDAVREPLGAGRVEGLGAVGDGGLVAGQVLGGDGAGGLAQPTTVPEPEPPPPPEPPPVPQQVGDLAVPLEQVAADLPVMEPDGCFPGLQATRAGVCRAGDPDGEITVGLFGDSHAGMWITALDQIGRERGWKVVSVARSSCPPTEDLSFAPGQEPAGYTQCLRYQKDAWPLLLDQDPDLVVLSSARYNAAPAVMAEALARRVDGLRAAGILPVLVRDVPRPDFDVPECLLDHRDDVPACTFDREEGLAASGRGQAELAALRPGLAVVDLTEQICPGPVCSPVVGDVVVWRDSNHLSATYIRSLSDVLEAELEPWVRAARQPEPARSQLLEGERVGRSVTGSDEIGSGGAGSGEGG